MFARDTERRRKLLLADIGAAANYLYFEPTEGALATANAAVRRGEIVSVGILLPTVAAVFVRRQRALLILSLPGVVGFAAFVTHPRGHGAPLLAVLAATLLAGVVSIVVSRKHRGSPAEVRR